MPPTQGAFLTLLGFTCFHFVTFALHNLCRFCEFGEKVGLHNPFYELIDQKTVKRPRFFLIFPILRFIPYDFPPVLLPGQGENGGTPEDDFLRRSAVLSFPLFFL